MIVQTNIQSVRDCDPTKLYTSIDTRPHFVVRRYAEYTSAISAIHGIVNTLNSTAVT